MTKGSVIKVNLFDAAISSLANQASNWLNSEYESPRMGSLHPNIAPYGETFVTKDDKLMKRLVDNLLFTAYYQLLRILSCNGSFQ